MDEGEIQMIRENRCEGRVEGDGQNIKIAHRLHEGAGTGLSIILLPSERAFRIAVF